MQFVSKAKHDLKSVTHVDGTARVQCVEEDNISILRPILEEFYDRTSLYVTKYKFEYKRRTMCHLGR